VVVGQNNVGKTALVEALGLQFLDRPNRSTKTIPVPGAMPINPLSRITVTFELSRDELTALLVSQPMFYVPARRDISTAGQPDLFVEAYAASPHHALRIRFRAGLVEAANFLSYDVPVSVDDKAISAIVFHVDPNRGELCPGPPMMDRPGAPSRLRP